MSDTVTVFEYNQEYILSRSELLENIEEERCDYSSIVLIKNFPEIKKFQKYTLNSICHYRPLVDGKLIDGKEIKKHILGEGTFGEVSKYADSPIVIKQSKRSFAYTVESILEYSILKSLRDSECCISKAFDFKIEEDNKVKIYLEGMNMDLEKYRKTKFDSVVARGEISKEKLIKSILFDIFRGVYYAHNKGIIHRDLKFENILITMNNAYVSDWGASFFYYFSQFNKDVRFEVGTPTYRAPEIWARKPYSTKVDVFALGIIATEMFGGNPHSTYQNSFMFNERYFMKNVYNENNKVILNKNNVTEGYELFSKMLSRNPDDRPYIHEVLNHDYFKQLRKEKNTGKDFSINRSKLDEISHLGLQVDLDSVRDDLSYLYNSLIDNRVTLLLAINIYVRYSNAKKALGLQNEINTASSCAILAQLFTDAPIFKQLDPITIKDIAETLDYKLFGLLAPGISSGLNTNEFETLLKIELTATETYPMYDVAKYVFLHEGSISYNKEFPLTEYVKLKRGKNYNPFVPRNEKKSIYNEEGYDQDGYDRAERDRDGYDRNGYNKEGYNRQGYNRFGYDRNGYNKQGYNRQGFNKDGRDANGNDNNIHYDEDGYDLKGYDRKGYDQDGYDQDGYDQDGYDQDGYDQDGYGRLGYDQDGYDRNGYDENGNRKNTEDDDEDDIYYESGYNAKGYDRDGFDRNGYDQDGYDRNDMNKEGYDRDGYNGYGYNREGYDAYGNHEDDDEDDDEHKGSSVYDKFGYNKEGFNRHGYDVYGRDRDGYDRDGFGRDGRDRDGYDLYGYNKEGYNKEGYNRDGYNRDGYDRNGYDKTGLDNEGFDTIGLDDDGFPRKPYNNVDITLEDIQRQQDIRSDRIILIKRELKRITEMKDEDDISLDPEVAIITKIKKSDYKSRIELFYLLTFAERREKARYEHVKKDIKNKN